MLKELPKLPYAYNALEPYIDAQTMEIHYTKHHQTYLNKLIDALSKYPEYMEKELVEILQTLDTLPKEIYTAVKNTAGGVYNHNFFWELMTPANTTEPHGELLKEINKSFGGIDEFKKNFSNHALGRFGSGWAWLGVNSDGKLEVTSTANQDSPISEGKKPIITLDVWEHAYYLKYQNKRDEYIKNWWNVVNWDKAEELFVK